MDKKTAESIYNPMRLLKPPPEYLGDLNMQMQMAMWENHHEKQTTL